VFGWSTDMSASSLDRTSAMTSSPAAWLSSASSTSSGLATARNRCHTSIASASFRSAIRAFVPVRQLTLTFSRAVVDFFIYVIDVAAGDKIPRQNAPEISQSDILVINKTDLAPHVNARLDVIYADSRVIRRGKPFVFTNCVTGDGVANVVGLIQRNVPSWRGRHPTPSA
jgi:putative protein kinase ArgK-like GTPase of G3E family